MSEVMYPVLHLFPHLLLKDKDVGLRFDCFLNHATLNQQMGSKHKHYSKNKIPIILPDPVQELAKYRR